MDNNHLMLFWETIADYCNNHTKHTSTVWVKWRVCWWYSTRYEQLSLGFKQLTGNRMTREIWGSHIGIAEFLGHLGSGITSFGEWLPSSGRSYTLRSSETSVNTQWHGSCKEVWIHCGAYLIFYIFSVSRKTPRAIAVCIKSLYWTLAHSQMNPLNIFETLRF